MNCPKCNFEIEENKNFCPSCGSKLGEYTLIVTRKKKTIGFAIPFPIYVDGNKIGDALNGKSLTYNLTKGEHKVSINSVEKNLEQGIILDDNHKTVEIIFQAKMGIIAAKPKILDIIYKDE